MNVKRIDEKLRKAIMMAYQYQINCEITPEQCKELVDFIDNPLEVEEVCEWGTHTYDELADGDWKFCPNCGKRVKYVEE